jgi:lipopolysaccharide transport system ATP-binding protein
MNDKVILVENLSKRYRIGMKEKIHDSFVGAITSWMKAPLSNYKRLRKLSKFDENGEVDDIIWALRDISFEVQKGEVLGIIGRNGAGKSTLLKILSRITDPTYGSVEIKGRVSSLLEVGTGFHPELTGRENIYLNGTILGMSKREINRKFSDIVEFSEIEKFIDTPIKRYSSGMKVRLGFSVAAHLEPELLLIDEVLAVGDVAFQQKCIEKMLMLVREKSKTILFVSHKMSSIKTLCNRGIVLDNGGILFEGDVDTAISTYLKESNSIGGQYIDLASIPRKEHARELIFDKLLFDEYPISYNKPIRFKVKFKTMINKSKFNDLRMVFSVSDQNYTCIFHCDNLHMRQYFNHESDDHWYVWEIENKLKPGVYKIRLFLSTDDTVQDWLSFLVTMEISGFPPYLIDDINKLPGHMIPKFSVKKENDNFVRANV